MSILQEYEDIRRQLGEEEWNTIDTFLSENKQYQLSDVLYKEKVWKIYEDWKRGSSDMKINRKKNIKSNRKVGRRPVKAAESYGWVVDENEAWEAYEFACDYFGKENLDDQIVSSLSVDELASSLAFIFRMNDFREWDERNDDSDDEDIEESRKLRSKRSIKAGTTSRDNVKPLSVGQARVFTFRGDPCIFVGVPDGMIFRWYSDSYAAKSELNYVKTVIKRLPNDWEESLREYGFDQFDDTVEYQTWSAKNPVKSSCGKKSVNASRRPVKAARITTDFSNFKPWSGAVDTWNELEKWDKIDLLEQILDDTYYNEEAGEAVMSETELNDLLWFEPETVYEWVGLYYNDETGEVSDEPFDSEDEDEYDEEYDEE